MGAPDGQHLGPYRLLSLLGAGGFGEVHLALDPLGRTVAVKVLHPQIAADSVALTRLAREVETMRRVRGPHIAEVIDASLAGPRPYVVTRYVQGRSLAAVLAEDGPLSGDDLSRLATGLAEALAAIHAAGVIHRDLKPANVLLADGEPCVIDFGIALALDSASVTASGAVVGTPGYLAPEVLEGHGVGPGADVFAWGATMAYAATGRQPYGVGPAPAVAYRVVHHEPDLDDVPPWLAPLLRDCLRNDPAARPTSAQLCARLGVDAPEPVRLSRVPVSPPRPSSFEPTAADHAADPAGGHAAEAPTREWRPGRRDDRRSGLEAARARHREKVRRWWVIGSGVFVAMLAAAARAYLPETALLLLAAYALVVLVDAVMGLLARTRSRVLVDLAGGVGAVALFAALSTVFSTFTLLLAVGTVFVVLLMIAFAS
jgi:serine/threonine protein kinase